MDPATTEILGIPGYMLFWVATLVAFGLFGRRIWLLVRLLHRAQPDDRFQKLGARIRSTIVHVLGQPRLLREWPIGVAHLMIFWSFVLFAGTFAWNLPRWLVPSLSMPYADEVPLVRVLFVVFSLLGLAAIGVAAVRRRFFPPPHLQRTRDASIILVLIALVLGTTILGMGFKAISMGPEHPDLHAIDRILASVFPAMSGMHADT